MPVSPRMSNPSTFSSTASRKPVVLESLRIRSPAQKPSVQGLQDAFSHLRAGDTLVVWRLDRLGRSLRHLIDTITELEKRGIGFKSVQENIDTTSSSGKLIFHIFGSLAEFERDLIRERTQAGLHATRSRGRVGGRPRRLDAKQAAIAQALYNDRKHTVAEICQTLGISRATFYRSIKAGKREEKRFG